MSGRTGFRRMLWTLSGCVTLRCRLLVVMRLICLVILVFLAVSCNARDILLKVGEKKNCTFYSMVASFLSDVLCFVAEKNIVLSCDFLRWYCKNLVDRCGRETLRFIFCGLILKVGLASLDTRWSIRCLKPVLRSYVQRYHAQNVILFSRLHVQSVGRGTKLHFGVSLNYKCGRWVWACSGSSGHWVWSVPGQSNRWTNRISVEECASQRRSVLAYHRSCNWYDQQGELGSDYHRVIARLIYPA